jgi:YidC/Oxa1 family membrane protein insertase
MDRNSAIGLTLIALIVILYFQFFAEVPVAPEPDKTETSIQQPAKSEVAPSETNLRASTPTVSGIKQVEERIITIENEDLIIEFTNIGGIMKKAELKDYLTFNQEPLILFNGSLNNFALLNQYDGKEIDLYQLSYDYATTKVNDTTKVVFTLRDSAGVLMKQIYSIPPVGYQIGYYIEDVRSNFISRNLLFKWNQQISQKERDPKETYNHTSVHYYSPSSGHDYLSERSTDPERVVLEKPVKWAAITEKFFTTAILAESSFAAGDFKTNPSASEDVVKDAHIDLIFSGDDLREGKANFSYYLGPKKYNVLKKVDVDFSRNLYLGWPPVIWVNKFIIIPLFQLFEKFFSNYGIIIILIVIVIKLGLTPLSYKSILSMAKMKVLKPELDEIKEKHGDDMQKAQQEQMKLYQQVGVNPISGCVPVLLQMPILFAMFYFFPVSIELRQASFLWASDLSTYDSVLNLPFTIPFYGSHVSLFTLLMTASTIVYTWQNNQMTSVQGPMKSMGYIMPIVFMFVLNSFPAALSFYYFVSNLVGFAQQAIIRRFVDDEKIRKVLEENKKRNANKKKSSFQLKLEEAMKASSTKKK